MRSLFPILGINYLNFEFLGRQDTQLAVLFAGVLAAGNIQRPKLGGTPFDASVDFFAIAVPSSDRLYEASGEREEERLLTWPLTTGLNLGWQFTPFQKASAQYQFRFDGFVARSHHVGGVRHPRQHRHQRVRRRLGVPARRLQRRAERHMVLEVGLARVGLRARPRVALALSEVQRERLTRFLFQRLPQGASERRPGSAGAIWIVSRSTSSGCSTTRGSTACRRLARASRSSA